MALQCLHSGGVGEDRNVGGKISAEKQEKKVEESKNAGDENEEECCHICWGAYTQSDPLGKIRCQHYFHQECITKWCTSQISSLRLMVYIYMHSIQRYTYHGCCQHYFQQECITK